MILILAALGCSRAPEKSATEHASGPDVAAVTAVLSNIPNDLKPPPDTAYHSDTPGSHDQAATYQPFFSESGKSVAYLAQKGNKYVVVKNNSQSKEYDAVGPIVISTDGQRIAYPVMVGTKWQMVIDGKEGNQYDFIAAPIFSPDGRHVLYQAQEGKKWFLVIGTTQNEGTMASYTTPVFSSDSSKIAYIEAAANNSDMKLVVSNLTFTEQSVIKSISDQLFTTDKGKTRIAVTQIINKKIRVVDFTFAKPDVAHEGAFYDVVEKLAVGDDGESVTYCALKDGKRLAVLNGKEESIPKGLLLEMPVIRPDKKGVGALLVAQKQFFFHQSFFNSTEKSALYDEAAHLTYSKDGRFYAYAARKGKNWFVVVNGKEGPAFDKVVVPLFSPDGKFLVYRARKDGKRFAVVADTNGKTIRQHPAYEQVLDLQFTADGKSVAYGVKDGKQLIWKVEKL